MTVKTETETKQLSIPEETGVIQACQSQHTQYLIDKEKEEVRALKKEVLESIPEVQKAVELDFDRDDKIGDDYIKLIFKSEHPRDALSDVYNEIQDLNLEYISSEESSIIDDIIESSLEEELIERIEGKGFDITEFVREVYQENCYADMNYKQLADNTMVDVYLQLHSNYDCLNSHWYIQNSLGYGYNETYMKNLIDFLNINPQTFKRACKENDILTQGKFPNYKNRDGKELVDMKDFIRELENNNSTSLFTIVVQLPLLEAIDFFENYDRAKTIEFKNAFAGLFDDSQGAGSMMECTLNGKRKIFKGLTKYDCLKPYTKHNMGYDIIDVYGMRSDFASDSEITLHK